MKIGRFNIKGNAAAQSVRTFLLSHYKDCFKKDHNGLLLIWNEHYYFRTESNLLYNIVLDYSEADVAALQVISGGGGAGLFNWSFWSEKDSIKIVWKDLEYFSKTNNLSIDELTVENFKTNDNVSL